MDAEEEKKFIQEVKNALLHTCSSIHLQYHLRAIRVYVQSLKTVLNQLNGYMTVPDTLYECQHVSDQARKCTCMKCTGECEGLCRPYCVRNTISVILNLPLELLWRQANIFPGVAMETSLHIFPFSCRVHSSIAGCGSF